MKLIHCADLHLDSKLETNLDSNRAKIRRKELVTAFENVVSFAAQNDVRAVIVAGDLFDHTKVTKETVQTVAGIIESAKEVDFLVLSGNHDDKNPFQILSELPQNLKFFSDSWTEYRYDNVSVCGICLKQTNSNVVYSSLELESDRFNIAVMHGDISGEINLSRLKNKNIDYLALGHLHEHSEGVLDARGVYAYCGCLESRGFDESGIKGFYLIDTDKKEYTFIGGRAIRNMLKIEVDITSLLQYGEIRAAVENALLKNGARENDMVKIILKGECSVDTNKDLSQLLSFLKSRFFFAKIKDESKIQINAEDYKNDLSLKGEFVRQVLSSELPQEEKEKIILCGIRAIGGEEIEL